MMVSIFRPPGERFKHFLRFLERYTKTDLKYLASGGLWLSFDQVATGLAAFLLAIAFANYVPKDVYGTYRYLLSAFWVLTAFSLTGLPIALAQAIARGKEGVYRSSFMTSLVWSTPLALIAGGASIYYFLNTNIQFGYGFLIIAILGPFMQPAYLFGAFLVGKKEFRMNSILGILFAAIPAIALFGAMFLAKGPLFYLTVYLASNVVTGFLLAFFTFIWYRPNQTPDGGFKKLGAHFSAMNLLSTIAAQVDKIVVFHYLGAVDLAVYAFATALPEQIKGVCNSIATLALPKFVARSFAEIRANFWSRLWLYTGLLVLVALAYILVAPLLFHVFFPAYAEAILFSQVYALSLIPIGNALPATLLQAKEAKRELYVYNILSPVFQIATLIVLTAVYGLMGAVIARILGRVWSFVIAGILLEWYSTRKSVAIS